MRASAIILGALLLLAACTSAATYSPQTADALQQRVLAIATSASSHDYAGALQQLSQLQSADDLALRDGTITSARHDAILTSILAVRADLTALKTAATGTQQTPTPIPQVKDHKHGGGGDGGGSGSGNGNGGD